MSTVPHTAHTLHVVTVKATSGNERSGEQFQIFRKKILFANICCSLRRRRGRCHCCPPGSRWKPIYSWRNRVGCAANHNRISTCRPIKFAFQIRALLILSHRYTQQLHGRRPRYGSRASEKKCLSNSSVDQEQDTHTKKKTTKIGHCFCGLSVQ